MSGVDTVRGINYQHCHALLGVHPGDDGENMLHDERREPLRRLVDEQQPVLVHERPPEGDHLLLTAGERAGGLLGALDEVGEQLVDERAPHAGATAALGEAEKWGTRSALQTSAR